MKTITFHINHSAYTVDIGEDKTNRLENGLKKFLSTEKNLSTQELLFAYLSKTQELIEFENNLKKIINNSILAK